MKKEIILAVVLSLVVGASGGYTIARSMSAAEHAAETHSHSEDDAHHHEEESHTHAMTEVPAEQAPTVDMIVEEDAKSGWNITIDTTNFTFSPENVNEESVIGEGHAHLYVEDEKVARLYGPNFHYDGEFDGTKTFRVTLNANDHSEYAIDGEPIQATTQVTHEAHD